MRRITAFKRITTVVSIFFLVLLSLVLRSDQAQTESTPSPVLAPITVTKSTPQLSTDANGNGIVNPGDTLTYTITVANGATDATGVIFTDVLDSNLTLVPGSINSSPIARNESFNVLGNVSITVPDGSSDVLSNDLDPDGTTPSISGFGATLPTANSTATGSALTTSNGGNVTLQSNGSFTYNPPAGFEGADSFFYTVSDGTTSDTAQVVLNVSGMIWFIKNDAPACTTLAAGCGRLSNPFSTLAAFASINNGTGNNPAAGDNIFIYTGTGNYDASLTLLNNQKLIGQGATSALTGAGSLTGLTVPPFSAAPPSTGGTNPTIITTAASSNAVNLGQNNLVRGLTISNTTGSKLSATTNVGTLTIGQGAGASDVTLNGNGQAINLTGGGTLAARFASVSSTNSADEGIVLDAMSGSLVSGSTTISNPATIGINVTDSNTGAAPTSSVNVDFANTNVSASGGTGVSLTNNTGTLTFADLDISPDSGQRALLAQNNSSAITTNSGTISTTNAVAIEITRSSGTTPLNVQLTSVSANGGSNGIVLTNTSSSASPGGFSILGAGSAGTGGTIQNTSISGASFTNAQRISLNWMNYTNANSTDGGAAGSCDSGVRTGCNGVIKLKGVTTVNLDRLSINGGVENGIDGSNVTDFSLTNSTIQNVGDSGAEFVISIFELFGTVAAGTDNVISGNTISNGGEHNIFIRTSSPTNAFPGTPDRLTFINNSISSPAKGVNSVGGQGDNITVSLRNTANFQTIVQNNTFSSVRNCTDAVQVDAGNTSNSDAVITGNHFQTTYSVGGTNIAGCNTAVNVSGSGTSSTTFNISNNPTVQVGVGTAINVASNGDSNLSGTISGHTVTIPAGLIDGVSNGTNLENSGFGIDMVVDQTGHIIANVNGNTVTSGLSGLRAVARNAAGGAVDVTINNNSFHTTGAFAQWSVMLLSGNDSPGESSRVCANLSNNQTSTTAPSTENYWMEVWDQPAAGFNNVIQLQGLTPATGATEAQVESFVSSRDISGATVEALGADVINYTAATCAAPPVPLVSSFEKENKPFSDFESSLSFLSQSYQPTLAFLSDSQSLDKQFVKAERIKYKESVKTKAVAVSNDIEPSPTIKTSNTNSLTFVSRLASNASSSIFEISSKLAALISPTVYSEERISAFTPDYFANSFVGETVCVDGNTDNSSCAGGFTLPANESTTITFRATVNSNSTATSIPNTANIAAAGGINQNSNTVNTSVVQPPSISKAFGSSFIAVGGTTTLTFTVSNNNPSQALSNVSYTDPLPEGVIVATPNGLVNNCGAATITAVGGSSSISVSGLSLAANSSCTIKVDVTGTTQGTKNNTTSVINSLEGGAGQASNTAILNVIAAPSFTKAFGAPTIPLNSATALTFSITNNSSLISLTNVSFTDNLPAGLVVATPPNITGSCGGGTITANAGASSISLSGATLSANAGCVFNVDVTGMTAGAKTNSVTLSTAELGNTPTASASMTVVAPPGVSKSFSPTSILVNGTSVLTISITNPSANTLSLTGVGVEDNFPSGIEVEGVVNTGNSCSTGNFTPNAGATSISISGATIPANTTCNFSIDVKATSLGAKMNTTGNVTSTEGGAGGTASATLNVGNTVTWTGATSSNWNVATNWSPAQVPSATNDVLIPDGMIPNEPVILAAEPDAVASGLTIESERTLSINAGRTLTVGGTLGGDGTINVTGALSAMTVNSTGLITFNGAASQTIPAGAYKNLTVNNAAGASLADDSTINGVLTLTNGIVTAGTNTVTFSTEGASTRGGSCTTATCFITGSANEGGVRKQFVAGTNPAFTIHVGTAGGTDNGYTPVALANINADAAGDSLTVRAVDDDSPASIITPKITRYWELTESGDVTADLTFTYLEADDNTIADPADLTLYRGATNVCITDCVDEAAFTATAANVTEFSPWTVAQTVPPAPETTIDSSPPNPSNSASASFSFSSPTGSTFECDLDGGGFSPCTSPKSYAALADGTHTFQVRAIDSFGNADPTPASFTWTIDTAAPDTTITTNPTDPSGANVSFSFTGTDSGTGVASFECALDGGSFSACPSPKSYLSLSQGSHIFQVRAIDGIGNVDPAPAAFMWLVDATPPETTVNNSPPNPSNSSSATFTFSGTDSGGSTVASFECSLDGGAFTACTSPQTYNSLSDGSHTFQVRAIDGVGNVDATPASYTWTVDSTGPDTSITANPTNPSNSGSATFSFTGTETGGSGVASFECQLDGGGFSACTSPQTYNSLTDGSHTFQVRAIDNAGNADSSPAGFTWTVDTAPPDTTINSGPANSTISTSAGFTFSGTDSGTGVASFECKLDGGSFAPCTSPQNYSSLSNGSHTFQVRAIDSIGNVDPTPASFTWTVDTASPSVIINQASGQSDPANGMGIQIHFTAVFNEPVTGFTSSDVTISGTAGATTATVNEISPNSGTTYDVAISGMTMGGTVTASIGANKATDAAGNGNNASTSTDNTVTYVPNTPPTAVADSYSTTQDTPLTVAAPGVLGNDSDPDPGNTITAVLISGPANAASFALNSDGSFNYTPNPGFTGTDSFTYKARDNFNAESGVTTGTLSVKYRFDWVSNGMLGGGFNQPGLSQVTAGSNVALRFTLYGYKADPYTQAPTSQPISCATSAPIGAATTINRFTPDPYYSPYFDFYQTTWQTQSSWKFTCRRLTLHLNDGTTKSLDFYFK